MKRLRGYVVSWFYPPGNSSEGLVAYKLLRNSGFDYDVFTRKTHDADMFDRSTDESKLTADNVTVIQANTNEREAWVTEAVEYFERNRDKYDFVLTRCMTAASHDAGVRIKQKYPDVAWVASFGDPLVNSPYIRDIPKSDNPHLLRNKPLSARNLIRTILSPTRRASKVLWEWQRKRDMEMTDYFRMINQATFELADLLIFNNDYQREHAFSDEYGDQRYVNKGLVINHSFDAGLYPAKTPKNTDGKLHFVYVGHLDGFRNAALLFEAIGQLKARDERLGEKVRFDFYGHIDDGDKAKIIDYDLSDIVFIHHDIDYLTSLKKIAAADWTILIDANLSDKLEKYIFCPAKLVDYLGARKKVLAITQTPGATADIMQRTRAGVIVPHDTAKIRDRIAEIIEGGLRGEELDDEEVMQYDAKNVAAKFDGAIHQLLTERGE